MEKPSKHDWKQWEPIGEARRLTPEEWARVIFTPQRYGPTAPHAPKPWRLQ